MDDANSYIIYISAIARNSICVLTFLWPNKPFKDETIHMHAESKWKGNIQDNRVTMQMNVLRNTSDKPKG